MLDILSYEDADHLKPLRFGDSGYTTLQPLQQRAILHDGQIIALVVAETLGAAEEAANAVRAEYEEEPASSTLGSPGTETISAVGNTEKWVSPSLPLRDVVRLSGGHHSTPGRWT